MLALQLASKYPFGPSPPPKRGSVFAGFVNRISPGVYGLIPLDLIETMPAYQTSSTFVSYRFLSSREALAINIEAIVSTHL